MVFVVAGEELVFLEVVDVLDAGGYAGEIDLIGRDPAQIGVARLGIVIFGAHAQQVGLAVGRMLHVLAEIDKVRGAHLDGAPGLAGSGKRGWSGESGEGVQVLP